MTAVGPGLTSRQVGDLVAYAGNPMGSYAEEQILPADRVIPVPDSVSPVIAASILLKGMTTQFLLRRCFKVHLLRHPQFSIVLICVLKSYLLKNLGKSRRTINVILVIPVKRLAMLITFVTSSSLIVFIQVEPGHTILVHAAAGGVGSLLCQWGNALGATVIGTVSTKEKAAQAKDDGAHHVIIYTEEDFVVRVNEITLGNGVDVVYDSVGKDTFRVTDTLFLFI